MANAFGINVVGLLCTYAPPPKTHTPGILMVGWESVCNVSGKKNVQPLKKNKYKKSLRGIETGSWSFLCRVLYTLLYYVYIYLSVYSRKGPSVIELLKNTKQKPKNSVVVVLHTRAVICVFCFSFSTFLVMIMIIIYTFFSSSSYLLYVQVLANK
jgi:hypothetical protein